MKRIISTLILAATLFTGAALLTPAPSASAINVFGQCDSNPANSGSAVCVARKTDNATSMITIVINTLLWVLGIIAVIMIIIGGIRYTTSNGDSSGLKSAKDTITYAVIGLVVAILAYSIVNFVVGRF